MGIPMVLDYGANPTIVIYNAVKIYNATSSLVRFENKNIFLSHKALRKTKFLMAVIFLTMGGK
jgi:hypothetical protein